MNTASESAREIVLDIMIRVQRDDPAGVIEAEHAAIIDSHVRAEVERERERCARILAGYGNEEFKRRYGVYGLIAAIRAPKEGA